MKRKLFSCLMIFSLLAAVLPCQVNAKDYSDYSNKKVEFGLNLRTDHKRPDCEKPSGVKLSDYSTYYYGKDAYKNKDKVIYLTFDCGYENGNTPDILDTLAKHDIKAIFFITRPYVKENPDLVKRMKEEGHLVGNHTTTHPSLPDLSVKEIKKEMNQCADAMKKLTGYDIDPYMRPPMGHYSVRVMKVLQDMGYSTMLWSLAIYDYEENDQPGAAYVVDKFKKHHFCGMMPLLHVISSSDAEALDEVIETLEDKGYRFGTVDEFAAQDREEESESQTEQTAAKDTAGSDEAADAGSQTAGTGKETEGSAASGKETGETALPLERKGNKVTVHIDKIHSLIDQMTVKSVQALLNNIG